MKLKSGVIYQLKYFDTMYVGSTSNLEKRMDLHRIDPTTTIGKIVGDNWDKVEVDVLEEYQYTNKDELRKLEQRYIDTGKYCNKYDAYRTCFTTKQYRARKPHMTCAECGKTYGYGDLRRHKKTKKHLNNIPK